ncbi:PREDICTED: peptidoglycan-recognition protein SC2-like [Ceratosolen solmsi marchali]|uniref:Peptidoglycan-recognition protein n=1 Tax=Ceratosolen solmsi marchali TaxID=326594 RepID=A0AAJ6YFP4_9HYME|nr:PREDICTED: peptidoglycan-recognition protein SC2-like [Ceratosolen solmsi marchali]
MNYLSWKRKICKQAQFKEDEKISFIRRSEWGATKQRDDVNPLKIKPPTHVIIHHSATDTCTTRAVCQAKIRAFQKYHMNDKKWKDIGYNFIIGEDGNIYEGRGWGKNGAHTIDYNNRSIGICIIGTYQNRIPNIVAIKAIKNLISYGVTTGNISNNYILIGHRQADSTSCPGEKLYQFIQTLPHWMNDLNKI